MRKFLPFLLLFGLALLKGFSQSDFRSGFVITNDLDTIHGLIDYRSEARNTILCRFRKDFSSGPVDYYPGEIYAYRFEEGKFFVSREVTRNGVTKEFFLEYLFNGIVNIYFYIENQVEYYLIEQDDGELHFLTNEELDRYIEGRGRFRFSTKRYIGQLRYVFAEHPDLRRKIDKASLNHTSLITIAHEYHKYVCPDEECVIYERKLPFISFAYGAIFSYSFSDLNFGGYQFFSELDINKGLIPSFGGLLSISLPRLHEKFSFPISIEIGRSYYHAYTERIILSSSSSEFHNIHIHSNFLKTGLSLKYTYPTGKIRPTFSAGYLGYYNFSGSIKRVSDVQILTTIYSQPDQLYPLPKFSNGFRVSLGFDYYTWKYRIPFISLNYDYIVSGIIKTYDNSFLSYQSFSRNIYLQAGILF